MSSPMNGKEYMQTQLSIIDLGRKAQALNLTGFLRCIANAETAAPLIDPTLYQKAVDNMTAMRDLAQALLMVQEKMSKAQEAVLKTSVAYFTRGEKQPGAPEQADVEAEAQQRISQDPGLE